MEDLVTDGTVMLQRLQLPLLRQKIKETAAFDRENWKKKKTWEAMYREQLEEDMADHVPRTSVVPAQLLTKLRFINLYIY